ncbi:MAG: Crp/Fnr family transcriptional regulator [Bacteroidetes bacterium]|nr:Crp/Fnr family transcriptional regulator [Bacteroidota bacterium]
MGPRKDKEAQCELCHQAYHKFFICLDKADLQYLNTEREVRQYRKGQNIFEEGHKTHGIFCIKEGQVKLYKNGFDGREHITRIAFPGNLIGLRALLSGRDYSVNATAMEDSTACFIPKSDFFQLMIKYPDFSRRLIVVLTQLLEEAEARLIGIAHRPLKERLAESLLFLHKSFHNTSPSFPMPYLNLTRSDLANIIGTTPETVIRMLSALKDERIISIKGRKIFILDCPRLEFIANPKY